MISPKNVGLEGQTYERNSLKKEGGTGRILPVLKL
jgi:hypothetical protein